LFPGNFLFSWGSAIVVRNRRRRADLEEKSCA
jgi:hypothetical protein